MRGAIPPLLRYAFMAWCSVKSTGITQIVSDHFRPVLSKQLVNPFVVKVALGGGGVSRSKYSL
jgi:hypothetical protein